MTLLWGYDWKAKAIHEKFNHWQPWMKMAVICLLAMVVLVFGMYGIGFQAEAFIYSRF